MPRIVVLGTGTAVGKTYFTSRLSAALASDPSNHTISAIKPIESGVRSQPSLASEHARPLPLDPGETELDAATTDAAILARESRPEFQPPAHAYSFPEPISPHLAARRTNKCIDISVAAAWVTSFERSRTLQHHNTLNYTHANQPISTGAGSWTLVETAGAALSPLAKGVTNLDFAHLLEPAIWILVAPDRLGVLHDLTTTLQTMRDLGRQPDSVVLSQATDPDLSSGTNARELRELSIAKVDVVLARGEPLPSDYLVRLLQLVALRAL